MPTWRISHDIWGWRCTARVMAAMVAAQATVLLLDPGSRSLAGLAAATGLIVFATVLAAGVSTYVRWRLAGDEIAGWLTVSLVLVAGPNLTLAGLVLADGEAARRDLATSLVVQALIVVSLLVVALVPTSRFPAVDPLALGIGLSLALSLLTAVLVKEPTPSGLSTVTLLALGAVPLVGAVGLTLFVHSRDELPAWGRTRLSVTIVLLAVAHVASSAPRPHPAVLTIELLALLGGAGLLCCTSLALARVSLRDSRHNLILLHDRLDKAEATVRTDRARLHEIGATVAGIASASRLISHPPVQLPVQRRSQLGDMIESEVSRLERLMLGESGGQQTFGLDDTIRRLVVRQQVQGQPVTWAPSGQRVRGCPDDVTEVLSILLDNAAKHGGRAPVTVQVSSLDGVVEISVTDAGPGVAPEVRSQLFDWGVRGADSSGQGIGLNIARDLAEKQGGYLMLADSPSPGTTFVVGLLSGERNDAVGNLAG